jgi:hypothetical protein
MYARSCEALGEPLSENQKAALEQGVGQIFGDVSRKHKAPTSSKLFDPDVLKDTASQSNITKLYNTIRSYAWGVAREQGTPDREYETVQPTDADALAVYSRVTLRRGGLKFRGMGTVQKGRLKEYLLRAGALKEEEIGGSREK